MTDEDEIDVNVMWWIVEDEFPNEIEISNSDKLNAVNQYLSGHRRSALEDETGVECSDLQNSLKRLWARFKKDSINEDFENNN